MKMIKGTRTKEVTDNKLVRELEKQGWVKADASPEVKATLKPTKVFTEVLEEDSEPTVEETPTAEPASKDDTN